MSTTHLESRRIGRQVEVEMRRGKSIFEALAISAMDAYERQERQKKTITNVWFDEMSNPQ